MSKRVPDPETLLKECDLSYTRSSGPGGQHVNKTDSAVVLLHRPTGIRFKVSTYRSQFQNKQYALERLQRLLAEKYLAEERASATLRFKNKPKRRPKRVKEKILKAKKIHSRKKSLRSNKYTE